MLIKSLGAWLGILVLAIGNGGLREFVLIPALGKTPGLVLSGVLLCVVVALVSYAFVRLARVAGIARAFGIGAQWLGLTLAFEFGFGRFIRHRSWSELLDAYAFADGNLWPLVLLVILLAPAGAVLVRAGRRHAPGAG